VLGATQEKSLDEKRQRFLNAAEIAARLNVFNRPLGAQCMLKFMVVTRSVVGPGIGAVTREVTGLEIECPEGALGASWGLDRYAVNNPYKLQHSEGRRATVASSCQRLAYWDGAGGR
jgi:hypothetical protein